MIWDNQRYLVASLNAFENSSPSARSEISPRPAPTLSVPVPPKIPQSWNRWDSPTWIHKREEFFVAGIVICG